MKPSYVILTIDIKQERTRPMKATEAGAQAIYLFIAELHGFKKGSVIDKEIFGLLCYQQHKVHDLDLSKEEDRKQLYENIWLERLYNELDNFYSTDCYEWKVPIELDASALT